ncbi:putative pentatricopeptide repeat-containing protein [Capsicum chinense]|nr:putative pentatricopeptide repeat-containing protein [Capsicum chinense]
MKSSTEALIKTLLNNPNSIKTNSQTKQLHAQIIKTRGSKSVSLNTIILGIYSNLNLLKESLQVFNNFTYVPAKAWKSLVRCYCCNGYFLDCLSCFVEMRGWGKLPSRDVFPSVIRACTHLKEFRVGECVHGCVIRFGMESDVYTGNALMNMYAKLQLSSNDCYVFGGIPQLNNRVSSRRSNVYGVAQDSEVGVDGTSQVPVLYQERRNEFDGIPLSNRLSSHGSSLVVDDSVSKGSVVGVDGMSQVPVLYQERRNAFDGVPPLNRFNNRRSSLVVDDSVYSVSQDSEVGVAGIGQVPVLYQERRNQLIRSEKSHFESLSGRMVKNARRLDSVSKIFQMMPNKDVVSWNTVIGGNVLSGLHEEALERLREMGNANLKPNCFTLSSVLPVFARHVDVSKGKEIHGYAIRHGFDKDEFIGSSLIDMYATCTRVEDSYRVFNLLPQKDDVSWNSIIAGCVQNGTFDYGLRLFRQMLAANVMPVEVSFSAILPACAHLTTLHLGKQLHAYITRMGFDQNMYVASSLVDMYAKCGKIMTARWIFDRMEVHDSVSWTAIIMGYALNGHACEATVLFENMQHDGINPNAVAYLAILTACSHAGLVDEGWSHFTSMIRHGVSPHLEHYAAIADLLGRAGKLSEAYKFITDMPIKPTGSVWATLLSACRVHKNVGLAEKVAKEMTTADPGNMSPYLLLSNMYSVAGRWKDASKLRTNMQKKGMRKPPACSWIEVRNQVHAFVSGDTSHPYYDQIHETLRDLYERLKQEGYVPQTSEALHDVDEEQKADLLYTHSERLAIAFGIISTPAETTIRITKNLRVCVDCHTAIKFISKIMEREIIIRDNSRFHLFKDGNCSCGDYW